MGVALPDEQQPDAERGEGHAVDELQNRGHAVEAQRSEEFGDEVVGNHRAEAGCPEPDELDQVGASENDRRDASRLQYDERGGQDGERGADEHDAAEKGAQLATVPIVFDIASERAGQPQHGERRGEKQKVEGQVPLAELVGIEPATEEDAAGEADDALHDGERQQDDHAVCQTIGARSGFAGWKLDRGFGEKGLAHGAMAPVGCRRAASAP